MAQNSGSCESKLLKREVEMDTVRDNRNDLQNAMKNSSQVLTANNFGPGSHGSNETAESSSSDSLNNSFAGDNPLKNQVILHHLFQLCPVSIVASCRLVCKQWFEESLITWRTAFPITIVMEDGEIFLAKNYHRYGCRGWLWSPGTPLKEFLEFIEKPESQCSSKPYRNIQLRLCNFSLNSEGFKVFWKAIGSNVTSLTISSCTFSSIEEFRQIIYNSCPILQKLKIQWCTYPTQNQNDSSREKHNELEYKEPLYGEHMHLKSLNINWQEGEGMFPVPWIELFSHFPSLTSLQASVLEKEYNVLIDAVRIIRKIDKSKLPFKRVQLDSFFNVSRNLASLSRFAIIKELHLPLRDCCIHVHPELNQRYLHNALLYLAPFLKQVSLVPTSLDLDDSDEDDEDDEVVEQEQVTIPTWFLDFPFGIQLDNLTLLESQGDFFGSFTFLKYMPNLFTLQIYDNSERSYTTATKAVSNSCMEELANLKMEGMKKLRLSFIVSEDDIRQLFNWMPNITDLAMVLNDGQFGIVCQSWKNLVILTVLGDQLLVNAGLTVMEKGQKGNKFESVGFLPNITNLKCIEFLEIRMNFTPESVFDLFLNLPSLQQIDNDNRTCLAKRKNLDIVSYQRAIEDNALEQWMACNRSILENQRSSGEEDDFDSDPESQEEDVSEGEEEYLTESD